MVQVGLRTVCGLVKSLMGYVSSVRVGAQFGDFLGLREKAFLHTMPRGRLAPRRSVQTVWTILYTLQGLHAQILNSEKVINKKI
jgi:hypothetical protein